MASVAEYAELARQRAIDGRKNPTAREDKRQAAADARFEAQHVARDWWSITRPKQDPIEVFFSPAQSQVEVERRYPRCAVAQLNP
jgi:hypothetical protein